MEKPVIPIAAILIIAALAGSNRSQAQQIPIKIGFMAELSGPQAVVGQDQYDAFIMVVEQNGGKLGNVPVLVLREDSQLKPDVATQIVEKLVDKEKVPIITGITFSNVMLAVHKPITEREIFLIGSNAGPEQIAGAQCSPYQFIVSWQTGDQAEAVGKYAMEKNYQRMIAFAPNYQAGKDLVAGFKRDFQRPLIDEIYVPLNQMDFSAELTKIASVMPDAIYVFLPGALGINFLRQYQQAGLLGKVPVLSTATADGTTLPALKESALGVIAGSNWGPDFDNAASRKFVDDFEMKYNRIPSPFAAQSYDAALLLDSALAKVKGNVADKKSFMAALKAADFKSVRGSFRFNNNHFPIQDMYVFEAAKDIKGRVSLKTIGASLKNHQDAYHSQCPLT